VACAGDRPDGAVPAPARRAAARSGAWELIVWKITYDPEADALYIDLIEDPGECRAVRLTDDIALDFVEGDRLAGIEVLGASRLGIPPDRPEIALERIKGVLAAVDLYRDVPAGRRPRGSPAGVLDTKGESGREAKLTGC
jgi:uncharacterized protein YuzE